MAGFWPLWMMLITLQIFAGDQACGADNFLRERLIRPCTLWWSRTVASFLAFGVFFLISFLGWWLGAQILGGQSHTTISDNMGYMLKIGAAFPPLVFLLPEPWAAACGLSGFSGLYLAAALTGAPYLVVILAEKWVRSLGLDLHPLVVLGARRQPLCLWPHRFHDAGERRTSGPRKFRRGGVVIGTGWLVIALILAVGEVLNCC